MTTTCQAWYKQKFDRWDVYCRGCGYVDSSFLEAEAQSLAAQHEDKLLIAAKEAVNGTPSR